jgi:hypothetical protein
LTVTFYCLHVFTLVYCCRHVGYMTMMGPSSMATGSGGHPIRIRRTPDPVGHRMKTGWGKADDSADGAPPVNPTAPRGAIRPPEPPTAVWSGPSARSFRCGVDGHPIRALMEAPPAVGRKNFRPLPLFRPGYAQSLALLTFAPERHPLPILAPAPSPGLPILARLGRHGLANIGTPLPPARLGCHGRANIGT